MLTKDTLPTLTLDDIYGTMHRKTNFVSFSMHCTVYWVKTISCMLCVSCTALIIVCCCL